MVNGKGMQLCPRCAGKLFLDSRSNELNCLNCSYSRSAANAGIKRMRGRPEILSPAQEKIINELWPDRGRILTAEMIARVAEISARTAYRRIKGSED